MVRKAGKLQRGAARQLCQNDLLFVPLKLVLHRPICVAMPLRHKSGKLLHVSIRNRIKKLHCKFLIGAQKLAMQFLNEIANRRV